MMSGLKYNTKNPVQAAMMRQGIVSTLRSEVYEDVLVNTDAVALLSATLASLKDAEKDEQLIDLDLLRNHFGLNKIIAQSESTLAQLILADMAFGLALAFGQVEDACIFSCNNMSIPDWVLCTECMGIGSTLGKSLLATWNWQRRIFRNVPQFLELATVHAVSAPYWERVLRDFGIITDESASDYLMTTPLDVLVGLLQGTDPNSTLAEFMKRVPLLMYTESSKKIPASTPITLYSTPGRDMHVLFNDCLRARGFQTHFIDFSQEAAEEGGDDEDYVGSRNHDLIEAFSHKRLNRRELAIQVLINRDAIIMVPVGFNFSLKVPLKSTWKPQSDFTSLMESEVDEDERMAIEMSRDPQPTKDTTATGNNKKKPDTSSSKRADNKPASAARATSADSFDEVGELEMARLVKKHLPIKEGEAVPVAKKPSKQTPQKPANSILSSLKKSATPRHFSDEEEAEEEGDSCRENKVASLAMEERELRESHGYSRNDNIDEYDYEDDFLMPDDLTEREVRHLDTLRNEVDRKRWLNKRKVLMEEALAKAEGRDPGRVKIAPPKNSKDRQMTLVLSKREAPTGLTDDIARLGISKDSDKKRQAPSSSGGSENKPPMVPAASKKPSLMDRLIKHQNKLATDDEGDAGNRSSGSILSSLAKKNNPKKRARDGDSEEPSGESIDEFSADSRDGDRPSGAKRRHLAAGDDIDDDDLDVFMSNSEIDSDVDEGMGGHHHYQEAEEEIPPTYYFRMASTCIARPTELFHAFHAALTLVGSNFTKSTTIEDRTKDAWEDILGNENNMISFFSDYFNVISGETSSDSQVFKFLSTLLQAMPAKETLEAENWVDLFEEKLYFPPKYSKDHLAAVFTHISGVIANMTDSAKSKIQTAANVWRREKTQKEFFDLITKSPELVLILRLLAGA